MPPKIPVSSRISTRGIRPAELLGGSGSDNNSGGPLFPPPPPPRRRSGSDNNSGGKLFGLGFIPDRPDSRDHDMKGLWTLADSARKSASRRSRLPEKVDLTADDKFGPVEEQGPIQCCTSQAVTSIAEYQLFATRGTRVQLSRLFLYKLARELIELEGDVGCTLRDTIKALNRYGCVAETRWPFSLAWLERLPRISDLEEARQWSQFGYCRLDEYNADGKETLENLLQALAAGFPVALGFTVCAAIDSMGRDAVIPFPRNDEERRPLGGHAVVAVGYDRKKAGGALLIRNSWGRDWGRMGYGWLPFEYVTAQLVCDCWALYRPARRNRES